jgi:hypothetical protein
MAGWSFKQLNIGGATDAPPAIFQIGSMVSGFLSGAPFISRYNDQMHVAYATNSGTVWDVWCTPFPKVPEKWNSQRIDRDGNDVLLATGPSIGVYQNQQHFCYIRGQSDDRSGGNIPLNGTVYDSFYDGSRWHAQQIGTSQVAVYGNINLIPPDVAGPFLVSVWSFDNQQHFTFLGGEVKALSITDAFYDGNSWNSQQINVSGNTDAPEGFSKPFGCVFTPPIAPFLPPASVSGQQHIAYRASDGAIWDAWFDGTTGHPWTKQKLNIDGRTKAPASIGGPCVWVVPYKFGSQYHNQQHFTYEASAGEIWDVWYDFPTSKWNLQKCNIDAAGAPYHTTNAPAAFGNPTAVTVGNMKSGRFVFEQHIAYRDNTGAIWDLWYDGDPQWHLRKVNLGETHAPAAIGDPFIFYYQGVDNDGTVYGQLHFAWQAERGQVWDAWFDLNPIPGQPTGRG